MLFTKLNIFSFYIIILFFQLSFGQDRLFTGKVIGDDLIGFAGVIIMTSDLKVIDTTDFNGKFEFKYSKDIKKIMLIFPMTQKEEIELSYNCNNLEIILLEQWTYDFVSLKRAKRKKSRDRKRILKKLYAEAYQNGVFKNDKPCR
jgi:hypothetical protein